jgi:hypothetical protein
VVDQPQGQPSEVQRARDEQERRKRSKESAAAARIAFQHQWVDQQIRIAHARGDFDDLPGAGKPIEGLGEQHDPDWWLKKLIEREQVTGVLPPALQLRKDDALLDEKLDSFTVETDVRREVEDFNARVIRARYTPVDGPPLITMPRDVETTVAAWAERRAARIAAARAENAARLAAQPPRGRRRWWRRGGSGRGTFQRPAAGTDG